MKKVCLITAIGLIALAAICVVFAAGPLTTMSIKRVDDPVKIQGQALKQLLGLPIEKMRVLIHKNGSFQPTPHQIDQRNTKGEWVFTIGEEKEASPTGGKLAANDELVFMAHDMGDAAPAGQKPAGAGQCLALTVTDPADGGTGWAYICVFDNPPAPSKTDYASYAVEKEWMWMIGQTYKIGTGVNESYFDKLLFRTASGWSADMLDRYKTRFRNVPIPGKEVLSEADANAKAVAWIDGPVRVIRKSKGWGKVAGIIKVRAEGSSQNIYYPSYFEIPLRLGIPKVGESLLKKVTMAVTLDFNHLFYGTKYYDAVNKQGMTLDGIMSDAEKNLDRKTSHRWWLVNGPQGTVMSRYALPPNMDKIVTTPTYYVDDKNALDPPEEEPGQSNVGLVLENFMILPPGEYKYTSFFYMPANFKWGDQDRILNMLDKPLQVKVTAL